MYFENVVFDATDPQTTGRAREAELGTETLTDEEAGFETRLSVPDGPELDLCFQRVPDEPTERPRLHLDVESGQLTALRLESADPSGTHLDLRLEVSDDADLLAAEITDRGGRELHFGWRDLPWRHFADPSGNEFCLLAARR